MSDQDMQARVDLAAALRLAARLGLSEGICNHFSYALPGGEDRILLNPYGLHWSEVRASDLLVVRPDGGVLEGEGEAELTAVCIHGGIHVRNPRARCVLHTHMAHATALTAIEDGRLEPVTQNALRFHGDVAYDDHYHGLAHDDAEAARMAAALGDKRVLFLANHGVIVTGASIAAAFIDLYYLERACEVQVTGACEVQVLAMSTGRPLRRVGDNVAAATFAHADPERSARFARQHFDALKRLLDRDEPGYAE